MQNQKAERREFIWTLKSNTSLHEVGILRIHFHLNTKAFVTPNFLPFQTPNAMHQRQGHRMVQTPKAMLKRQGHCIACQ